MNRMSSFLVVSVFLCISAVLVSSVSSAAVLFIQASPQPVSVAVPLASGALASVGNFARGSAAVLETNEGQVIVGGTNVTVPNTPGSVVLLVASQAKNALRSVLFGVHMPDYSVSPIALFANPEEFAVNISVIADGGTQAISYGLVGAGESTMFSLAAGTYSLQAVQSVTGAPYNPVMFEMTAGTVTALVLAADQQNLAPIVVVPRAAEFMLPEFVGFTIVHAAPGFAPVDIWAQKGPEQTEVAHAVTYATIMGRLDIGTAGTSFNIRTTGSSPISTPLFASAPWNINGNSVTLAIVAEINNPPASGNITGGTASVTALSFQDAPIQLQFGLSALRVLHLSPDIFDSLEITLQAVSSDIPPVHLNPLPLQQFSSTGYVEVASGQYLAIIADTKTGAQVISRTITINDRTLSTLIIAGFRSAIDISVHIDPATHSTEPRHLPVRPRRQQQREASTSSEESVQTETTAIRSRHLLQFDSPSPLPPTSPSPTSSSSPSPTLSPSYSPPVSPSASPFPSPTPSITSSPLPPIKQFPLFEDSNVDAALPAFANVRVIDTATPLQTSGDFAFISVYVGNNSNIAFTSLAANTVTAYDSINAGSWRVGVALSHVGVGATSLFSTAAYPFVAQTFSTILIAGSLGVQSRISVIEDVITPPESGMALVRLLDAADLDTGDATTVTLTSGQVVSTAYPRCLQHASGRKTSCIGSATARTARAATTPLTVQMSSGYFSTEYYAFPAGRLEALLAHTVSGSHWIVNAGQNYTLEAGSVYSIVFSYNLVDGLVTMKLVRDRDYNPLNFPAHASITFLPFITERSAFNVFFNRSLALGNIKTQALSQSIEVPSGETYLISLQPMSSSSNIPSAASSLITTKPGSSYTFLAYKIGDTLTSTIVEDVPLLQQPGTFQLRAFGLDGNTSASNAILSIHGDHNTLSVPYLNMSDYQIFEATEATTSSALIDVYHGTKKIYSTEAVLAAGGMYTVVVTADSASVFVDGVDVGNALNRKSGIKTLYAALIGAGAFAVGVLLTVLTVFVIARRKNGSSSSSSSGDYSASSAPYKRMTDDAFERSPMNDSREEPLVSSKHRKRRTNTNV